MLGLLGEREGIVARVLEALEISLDAVRERIIRIIGRGDQADTGQIPLTPRASGLLTKRLSDQERLGGESIDTEHVLLRLMREDGCLGARVLRELGVNPSQVEDEVMRILDCGQSTRASVRRSQEPQTTLTISPGQQQLPGLLPLMRAGSDDGPQPRSDHAPQHLDRPWLVELGAHLRALAEDIRGRLARDIDTGDLLITLAYSEDTLASKALRELGIDPIAVAHATERVRRRASSLQSDLARRRRDIEIAEDRAIEAQEFEEAALLRDRARALRRQARTSEEDIVPPGALPPIRQAIGVPRPSPCRPRHALTLPMLSAI